MKKQKSIKTEDGWIVGEMVDGIQIALKIELTPELIREGMYRDFVRGVNSLRKKALISKDSPAIDIYYEKSTVEIDEMIEEWYDKIVSETLADSLTKSEEVPDDAEPIKINNTKIKVWIQ